jgi:hypothetical protein
VFGGLCSGSRYHRGVDQDTRSHGVDQDTRSQEERQVRPGHFWLLKFGKVPASNSCVEKEFKCNGD